MESRSRRPVLFGGLLSVLGKQYLNCQYQSKILFFFFRKVILWIACSPHALVLSGRSSFLPQSKDKHVGLTGGSKLVVGVNISMIGYLSILERQNNCKGLLYTLTSCLF